MNGIVKSRIIFFGTPEFAVPTLNALVKAKFDIVGVVTKPDEPAGRKQILTPPPIKVLAKKLKIPVWQPATLDAERWVDDMPEADVYVVVAYGKIIPNAILNIPAHGTVNIHPSLLPLWRGPSPIQSSLLAGDDETGVTIMKIDELMDHGPTIGVKKIKVKQKATYQEMHDVLATLGAKLLTDTLPDYIAGDVTPTPQDDNKATFSSMIKKNDGRIKWARPAEEIERMTRALNPWPGTWTLWPAQDKILRIKIDTAEIYTGDAPIGSPGYVWQDTKHPLLIKTAKENLAIKTLTIGGKKTTTAASFINGYPDIIGTTLI